MTLSDTTRSSVPPSAPNVPSLPGKRRRAGFTIIELWVVLLVLVFVTGLSLAAFRGKTKRATLQRSRGSIASDLRLMREYSLSGKTVSVCDTPSKRICPSDGSCATPCSNEVPAGGFGVYFTTCAAGTRCPYYLFADLDGKADFDSTTELLPNGERVMEYPTIVYTLVAHFSSDKPDTYAQVIFTPFTGSAQLDGTSVCCTGGSGGGSPEKRKSEMLTVGPPVGTAVRVIMKSGGAGIQEQF